MKLAEDEAKSEKQASEADKRGKAAEAKRIDGKSGDKSGEQSPAAKPDKTTDKPNEKTPGPAQQAKDAVNKLRGLFGK